MTKIYSYNHLQPLYNALFITTFSEKKYICLQNLFGVICLLQELNRLRRAALSFGMQDFLEGISQLLERECTLLPGSAHVDAALQLTHAAKLVKNSVYKEYDYTIAPLSTNFTGNT